MGAGRTCLFSGLYVLAVAVCASTRKSDANLDPLDLRLENIAGELQLEQAHAKDGIVENGNTPPLSCPMRKLAMSYAKRILGRRTGLEDVYDALAMNECNTTRPVPRRRPVERAGFQRMRTSGTVFFVSADGGDDSNPGSEDKPFRTLHGAQAAIRRLKRPECTGQTAAENMVEVCVRKGVYFLEDTLELTEEDSCTSWGNYDGESVTISGGFPLANLSWTKTSIGNATAYKAQVKSPNSSTFDQLFVNGKRQIRARYPNGDPTIPGDGMIHALGGIPHGTPPSTGTMCVQNIAAVSDNSKMLLSTGCRRPQTNTTVEQVSVPEEHRRPTRQDFSGYHGGSIDRFDTTYNWPYWNTNSPTGMVWDKATFSTKMWSNPQTGVLHAYHSNGWGGWMWSIRSVHYENQSILFERGGYQEARGGGMGSNPFYVENIFEELDAEKEWFYDSKAGLLYFIPDNETDVTSPSTEIVGTNLKTLISIRGNSSGTGTLARNITISGVTITHSGLTFLEKYEVPSGGDWSIHRGSAVFLENAESISVTDCHFDQPGGNGLMLSNYVGFSSILRNDFTFCGDSAVCSLGSSQLMTSEGRHFPIQNVIERNHIHDVGVFGKQTSAYFKAIAMGNLVRFNIMYNGPRAGVNFNDGFIGGEVLEGNILFNFVRETGDHGMFNSWDRQPYVYKNPLSESDGWQLTPAVHQLRGNLIFNTNFKGSTRSGYCIDLDDGSSQYNITGNVMVYGGVKVRDGIVRLIASNLFVYSHSPVDWQIAGFNSSVFERNFVVTSSGIAYVCIGAAFNCGTTQDCVKTDANTFITPYKQPLPFLTGGCKSDVRAQKTLAAWQAEGHDQGSKMTSDLTDEDVEKMATDFLKNYPFMMH